MSPSTSRPNRTPSPIARRRLAVQQLTTPQHDDPAALVSWLVAVQAQDYLATKWAIGMRLAPGRSGGASRAATEATIDRALADGTLIRTHAMRWTWQIVLPKDVRWLVALVASRLVSGAGARFRELELDDATLRRSHRAIERALRDGAHLTRAQVAATLESAGVSSTEGRLSHILGHAELAGLICSGAPVGKQTTSALLDLRAPGARPPMPRDEAIAELALRYFRSRGPASAADFSWWAGVTLTEARRAIANAGDALVEDDGPGGVLWRADAPPPRASSTAHLVPAFDEYLVAYVDRTAVLAPEHQRRINAGGGLLAPCVVVDGQVVGWWRRTLGRSGVTVEATLFAPVSERADRAIRAAAARYAAFIGRPLDLAIVVEA